MAPRRKSVRCPECGKRLSPQGLNGHLRFVHGIGATEASKSVARAPRRAEPSEVTSQLEERIAVLEEQVQIMTDHLIEGIDNRNSPSGMRRRLVTLVAELADVMNQRSGKEWNVLWSGSDESKRIVASLDQLESDIRAEIADLTTRLGESEA